MLGVEKRVDSTERLGHRLPQILCALHANLSGVLGSRVVEGLGRNRVCQARDGSPIVDLGLRTFGLELVQNRGELGHLFVAQVELVRQKAERTPYAETAAMTAEITETASLPPAERTTETWPFTGTFERAGVLVTMTSPTRTVIAALAFEAVRRRAMTSFVMRTMRFLGVFPPNICRMHVVLYLQLARKRSSLAGVAREARSKNGAAEKNVGRDAARPVGGKCFRQLPTSIRTAAPLSNRLVKRAGRNQSNVLDFPYLGAEVVELTFVQRMRLKATALRAAAVNRAVHAAARVRYAMPDAHPKKHGVAILRNVVYGPTTAPAHRLDVYVPLREAKPRPVVMYVHGGGFSMLSKDTHRVMAMAFARRGYIVFNINYRLGQKNPFPAPLEDASEALIWVKQHASEYGGDPNRLILAGESAGGNLVAALALACATPLDDSFLKRLYDANISPVATISTYPFADLTSVQRVLDHPRIPFWAKHMTFDAAASYAGGHVYDLSQISRLASPLLVMEDILEKAAALGRPLSPFFLAVGTKDPLIEDSRRMKRVLDALGVACELHISPGEVHGFDAMVWRPAARHKWKAVHEFLARMLTAPRVEEEVAT